MKAKPPSRRLEPVSASSPALSPVGERAMAPAVVDLSAMAEAIMRINERLTAIEKKLEPSAEEIEAEDAKKMTPADNALVKSFITRSFQAELLHLINTEPALLQRLGYGAKNDKPA